MTTLIPPTTITRNALPPASLKQLFTEARTHHAWTGKTVPAEMLHAIYDLMKWGPTSVNSLPFRVLFIQTQEAKEKLFPALMGGNAAQVQAAPVACVIAYDTRFYDHLPVLFPHFDARSLFTPDPAYSDETALRSSTLQGAYFMLAARALGLDVGPMSGFDNALVDETFFKGTTWKSNFICNVGYGDDTKLAPRDLRLAFDDVCKFA